MKWYNEPERIQALALDCYFCGTKVGSKELPEGETLPPWLVARWHERMVAHIRRYHLSK